MRQTEEEVERIERALSVALSVMDASRAKGIPARLLGGLAVWERCNLFRPLLVRHRRSGDFDLVVHLKDRERFERLLGERFDFFADSLIGAIPGETHARFYTAERQKVCDITYDEFVFNHRIDLKDRLETDEVTIPLAELLLTKLQIVHAAPKDTNDIISLLLNHDFGTGDGESINLPAIIRYCSSDWGLERTVRLSVFRTAVRAIRDDQLNASEKLRVAERSLILLDALERGRKALAWRLRGLCGNLCRWYEHVQTEPDPRIEDLRIPA